MGRLAAIDFQKVDAKAVSILCREAQNVEGLVKILEGRGFRVQVETSINQFFQRLDQGVPGHVLISRTFKTAVGLQLPGFLQRKFNIPVATFDEDQSTSSPRPSPGQVQIEQNAKLQFQPEILHIRSDASPEEVSEEISNFEQGYKKRLEELKSWKENQNKTDTHVKSKGSDLHEKIWQNFQEHVDEEIFDWGLGTRLRIEALQVKEAGSEMLVIWSVPDHLDEHKTLDLQNKISEMLKKISPEISLTPILLNPGSDWEHYSRLIENAEHQITGQFAGLELMLSLYAQNPKENMEALPQGEGFAIPLEDWFVNSSVGFRLYLWLERNQKRVLYVRPGLSLLEKSFERFQTRGVKALHIDREDWEKYQIIRSLLAA